jgi:hypothetical protein
MTSLKDIRRITTVAIFEDEDFDMALWRLKQNCIEDMIKVNAKMGEFSLIWDFSIEDKTIYEMIAREYRLEGYYACISKCESQYTLEINWGY